MWDEPLGIVVDNSSPDIHYEGQWTPHEVTPDIKNFKLDGPPFSQSLRAPRGTASILFDFIGKRLQVQGTINNLRNLTVSITCRVDGKEASFHEGFDYQLNNFAFCDTYDISPTKPHTLNFTITVPEGDEEPMLFDRLFYIPSNSTLGMDKALLSVDDKLLKENGAIEYDRFWAEVGDGSATDTRGSKVAINFNGTSLHWFGFWYQDQSTDKAIASYSLDNQAGVPMEIQAITVDQFHYLNEPLLQLDNLSPGPHRLEVTYTSESKTGRPLTLDYVVIQNEPVSSPSQTSTDTTPTPSSSPSSDVSAGPAQSKTELTQGSKIGIGVGVGIGGLLILLLALFYLHRRRQARRSSLSSDDEATQPAMPTYNPVSPASPTTANAHPNSTSTPPAGSPPLAGVPSPADGGSAGPPIALMYHEDSGIRLDDDLNPRPADDLFAQQSERPPTYRKGA